MIHGHHGHGTWTLDHGVGESARGDPHSVPDKPETGRVTAISMWGGMFSHTTSESKNHASCGRRSTSIRMTAARATRAAARKGKLHTDDTAYSVRAAQPPARAQLGRRGARARAGGASTTARQDAAARTPLRRAPLGPNRGAVRGSVAARQEEPRGRSPGGAAAAAAVAAAARLLVAIPRAARAAQAEGLPGRGTRAEARSARQPRRVHHAQPRVGRWRGFDPC